MKNKIYFSVLAALMIAPILSVAQAASIDADVDQELDQMYAAKQGGTTYVRPAPVTGSVAGTASNGSQPIYILNQATPTSTSTAQAQQVQKQPVAVIESSPLVESKAEMMRKSRQDAEVQTEQKIVEKLEASRLEDERRRAEALFGNRLGNSTNINAENSTVSVQTQQQAAVVATPVVTAQPVVVAEPKEDVRGIIREELRAKADEESVKPTSIKYFSGMAGISDYADVSNVRGNYTLGATFGQRFDYMIVEGSFLYSNYDLEQVDASYNPNFPKLIDMNQYQGAIAVKYQLMSGLVRPVVGGIGAYSYRQYKWKDVYSPYGVMTYRGASSESHAIDLGVSAGVDLEFNKDFALGFDYRYMFNLSSRTGNQGVYTTGLQSSGTPIERLSYYTLGLAAKVNF